MKTPEAIVALYESFGSHFYSEEISQVDHAVQAAMLAQSNSESKELVLAALLHDIGHLVHLQALGNGEAHFSQDLRHEVVAADVLAGLLPNSVISPIRWHVAAKRWLCTTESGYLASLSRASVESLHFQGGIMTSSECAQFAEKGGFVDAIQLRRWDDEAKVVGIITDPIGEFRRLLAANWI